HAVLRVGGAAIDAAGEERRRPAAMRPDELDVRIARGVAVEGHADDGARRVGAVLDASGREAVAEIPAAVGRCWMNVDDRLAPVELLHHGPKRGVAEPRVAVTGEQP